MSQKKGWFRQLAEEISSAPLSNGERMISVDELETSYVHAGNAPDGTLLVRKAEDDTPDAEFVANGVLAVGAAILRVFGL